jgi:GNAT superfamily N-acetyltransferase
MMGEPSVRRLAPHEWPLYRELRLSALADSPEAFGGTLSEEQARTDAEWANRLESGNDPRWNLPLIGEVGAEAIGLAWGRIEISSADVANLYQMWVAPKCRGRGAGRLLLETVIEWARAQNARYLDLGVTSGDTPAMRLYLHAGFKPIGELQALRPGSGLWAQPMRLELRK